MMLPWPQFWAEIVKDTVQLGRFLYQQTKGNPVEARAAIRRMKNYAADWYATRDENTRALEAFKAEQQKG